MKHLNKGGLSIKPQYNQEKSLRLKKIGNENISVIRRTSLRIEETIVDEYDNCINISMQLSRSERRIMGMYRVQEEIITEQAEQPEFDRLASCIRVLAS